MGERIKSIGSRSERSDEPPKLIVAGVDVASAELQKGFDLPAAPLSRARTVPMPTETAAPLPLLSVPSGGLMMLTKASVVSDRSPGRQACWMPVGQLPEVPLAAQLVLNTAPQFAASDLRTVLLQL
jgi:hypothetical protein